MDGIKITQIEGFLSKNTSLNPNLHQSLYKNSRSTQITLHGQT